MDIKSISLAATTALILSASVDAAIISTDWQNSGDNLITTDTTSGLKWLDLTETNDMSYGKVSVFLGAGQIFEGFRFATSAEVISLWANWSIDLAPGANTKSDEFYDGEVEAASLILGNTMCLLNCNSYPYGTQGLVFTDDLNSVPLIGAYITNGAWYDTWYQTLGTYDVNSAASSVHYGSYLVSTVPVPAAAWLFGTGLLGLIGVARRKKS